VISIAGISTVILLAAVRAAAPGGAPVRVVWDAPAGCSDAESFFQAVASRAERVRRAEPGEEGTRLEVKLARLGTKVHGELRLATDDGRGDLRKVDGATCDEVAEALSLTAALALSVSARPAAPAPSGAPARPLGPAPPGGQGAAGPVSSPPLPVPASPAPPPPPSGAAAPTAAPPAVPPNAAAAPATPSPAAAAPPASLTSAAAAGSGASAPGRSPAAWLAVGLGPAAGEVVAPRLSLGGTAHLRVESPGQDRLAPSAALGFLYLRNDLVGDLGGKPGDALFRLVAATVTACPGWGRRGSAVSVEVCATGVGGWLLASDAAVTVSRSVTRSWWSAGALLRARAPVGAGFVLQLDASASVPLVKRRFVTTTPEQTVGTSPSVALIFGLTVAHGL